VSTPGNKTAENIGEQTDAIGEQTDANGARQPHVVPSLARYPGAAAARSRIGRPEPP
jgi:hypothetical protein